jgi:3-dehydroquinate dehydratase-2
MKILILNGPNLNMLGKREPEVYGTQTLDELMDQVRAYATEQGIEVAVYTSNCEGALIDRIHEAAAEFDGIVFNPAAYTHYSYALRDAVASIDIPVVEVHLTDITSREEFRQISVIAPECVEQFAGGGVKSYLDGVNHFNRSD